MRERFLSNGSEELLEILVSQLTHTLLVQADRRAAGAWQRPGTDDETQRKRWEMSRVIADSVQLRLRLASLIEKQLDQ